MFIWEHMKEIISYYSIILTMIVKVKVLFARSCPTLCDPMGRNPPWSSSHENFQARILEWISIPFRGSFQPRNRTWVCCPEGRFCTLWAIREVQYLPSTIVIFVQDSYHCLIKWNIKIYGTTEMEAFCKFWINDYHYCCLSLSWKIFYSGSYSEFCREEKVMLTLLLLSICISGMI